MGLDFSDIISEIENDGQEFEEIPVTIEQFVEDKHYLGLPPLSDLQYIMIRSMTQIYHHDTLIRLYGAEEGEKRWKQTYNEIILKLGKGSGKNYSSVIHAPMWCTSCFVSKTQRHIMANHQTMP